MMKKKMRIFSKDVVINRLSLILTFSRFNNTFIVMFMDDLSTIKFFNNISLFKHSLFLRKLKFSDAYVCFFKNNLFFDHLNYFSVHLKNSINDGQNMLLSYVYNGIFVNLYNINLIENLLHKYKYFLDFENFFIQTIIFIIILLENIFICLIDSFLLFLENKFINFLCY